MSTLPRNRQGLLISAALAVLAAVVAGAFFFTSGKATEVDLTAAAFVPGDAAVYVGLNTDLSSSQWVSAFKLAERLGQEDAEKAFREAFEDGGELDWEEDVAPFLGGDIAIYIRSFTGGDDFDGAVIVRAKDATRARDVVTREIDGDFEVRTYEGQPYQANDGEPMYVVVIGSHLVIAASEDSLKSVIDTKEGREKSITENADFRALRDDLTRNFIGFVYMDPKRILDETLAGDPDFASTFGLGDTSLFDFKPTGAAVTAGDGGFAWQSATRTEGKSFAALKPRSSRFAKLVPAETWFFASTTGVDELWNEVSTGDTRDRIDEALGASGELPAGTFDEYAALLGVESLEDVIELLNGEVAMALWDGDEDGLESATGVFLAEVGDEAKARDIIRRGTKSSKTSTVTVDGQEVTLLDDGDSVVGYFITDGYLVAGPEEAVRTFLTAKRQLADDSAYKHSVKSLNTSLGTYLFMNLHTVVNAQDAVPVDGPFDELATMLEGFIVTSVEEGGLTRSSGVISVKE
jgi:Protein of unknown function (DUF3352)